MAFRRPGAFGQQRGSDLGTPLVQICTTFGGFGSNDECGRGHGIGRLWWYLLHGWHRKETRTGYVEGPRSNEAECPTISYVVKAD